MTLEQFVLDRRSRCSTSTDACSRLIGDLSVAAKIVARTFRRAGVPDERRKRGTESDGDGDRETWDAVARREFVRCLRKGGTCGLIGTEKEGEPVWVDGTSSNRESYVVFLSPLDASSNIDVAAPAGTMFSVYALPETWEPENGLDEVLLTGCKQAAAGYVVYGPSTVFVFTSGDGVNGFTLAPSIGEFVLSHPDLRIPELRTKPTTNGDEFSDVALGLSRGMYWLNETNADAGLRMQSAGVGSFVSTVHRILLRGGVGGFASTPGSSEGSVRLLCAANPMAFVLEQAGGRATDGERRILDIEPAGLHQQTALILGSPSGVRAVEALVEGKGDEQIR